MSEQNTFCVLEDKKKKLGGDALEKAEQMLLKSGFKEEKITLERPCSTKKPLIYESDTLRAFHEFMDGYQL